MTQWLIGGVVVLALLVGGLVFLNQGSEDAMMKDGGATEIDAMMEKGAMMKEDVMEKSVMKEDEAMMEKDAMTKEDAMKKDAMMQNEGVMMEKGSYEPYAASKLTKANNGDVVLFFRAGWCPTCRALDSDIKANVAKIPAGVTILDVNYDTETALKQKYGVTYQHTLVQVDASGNLITKWSGGLALSDLVNKIQ